MTRRVVLIGVIAAVVGTGLLALRLAALSRSAPLKGELYTRGLGNRQTAMYKLLGIGDGQAFATLARDPTLSRPEQFLGGDERASYRASRPLFAYFAWTLSLGQRDWVPGAMTAVVVAAAGAAAAGLAALIERRGGSPWPAAVVVLLPGALAALLGLIPEMLALAFAVGGLLVWERDVPRPVLAGGLFALGALTRETMVLVPLVLLVADAVRHTLTRRRLAALALPVAALAVWYVVLRLRIGAWPNHAPGGPLGWPLWGLLEGVTRWDEPALDAAWLGLGIVAIVAAVCKARRDVLTWIVLAFAALALFMGVAVWHRWEDFSRPILPMYAFALVVVAGSLGRAPAEAESRATGPPRSRP
jgi:hypothetical protein